MGSVALQLTDKKGKLAGQKTPSFFPVCVILSACKISPEKVVPAASEVSAVPFRTIVQCSSLGEEWAVPLVVPRGKVPLNSA